MVRRWIRWSATGALLLLLAVWSTASAAAEGGASQGAPGISRVANAGSATGSPPHLVMYYGGYYGGHPGLRYYGAPTSAAVSTSIAQVGTITGAVAPARER